MLLKLLNHLSTLKNVSSLTVPASLDKICLLLKLGFNF